MVSKKNGKPVSAKFEIENGKPQLSVYIVKREGPRSQVRDRLSAGGRWIRTSGTAAQKPWISAAFRALRGYRRGS